MAILIRNPETDRKIRVLAKLWDCTLQEAVDRAVSTIQETEEQRRERLRRATRELQQRVKSRVRISDGLTHKQFFDREYGDA